MTYEEQCNLRVGDMIAFEESHIGTVISILPGGAAPGVRISWKPVWSNEKITLSHYDLLSPKYILLKRCKENTIGIEEII